jgi:ribosomal protein S18 acetylase RimI-like enzyme
VYPHLWFCAVPLPWERGLFAGDWSDAHIFSIVLQSMLTGIAQQRVYAAYVYMHTIDRDGSVGATHGT